MKIYFLNVAIEKKRIISMFYFQERNLNELLPGVPKMVSGQKNPQT